MHFEYIFQYLFSMNGEIYQNHITLKPPFLNRVMWRLHLTPTPYTGDDLDEAEKAILSGAMSSIDKLIAEGVNTRQARRQKEREIENIESDIEARSGKPCLWQAIESKQGFYYRCLTHGMAVKMVDGQKPVHDVLSPMQVEDVNI